MSRAQVKTRAGRGCSRGRPPPETSPREYDDALVDLITADGSAFAASVLDERTALVRVAATIAVERGAVLLSACRDARPHGRGDEDEIVATLEAVAPVAGLHESSRPPEARARVRRRGRGCRSGTRTRTPLGAEEFKCATGRVWLSREIVMATAFSGLTRRAGAAECGGVC